MMKKLLAKVMTIVMIITAFMNTGIVIHAEDIVTASQNNTLTIYYYHGAWKSEGAYIHYKLGNNWTASPGIKMEKLSYDEANVTGCTWKAVIDLKSYSQVTACFNNGSGTWDSNSGKNYKLNAGVFKAVYSSSKKYSKITEISVPTPTATQYVTSTPVITNSPVITSTPVITETPVITQSPYISKNLLVVHYQRGENTSWSSAYIHYKLNGKWTVSPGVKMTKASSGCWTFSMELPDNIGVEDGINCCFNNGKGSWDNNNNNNYIVRAGENLVDQQAKKVYWNPLPVNVTEQPTLKPTVTPTVEPTATPTAEPTLTPTVEPTATPTAEPTLTPTVEPTATPTVEPTATPTVEPTLTPTVEPTATPTVEPTATPTVEPTVTPLNDKILTVYYQRGTSTSWTNAYIHYKVDGQWTKSPGVMMTKISSGYWKYDIMLGEEASAVVCFNNGKGSWDSNNSKNYTVYPCVCNVDSNTKTVTRLVTPVPTATPEPGKEVFMTVSGKEASAKIKSMVKGEACSYTDAVPEILNFEITYERPQVSDKVVLSNNGLLEARFDDSTGTLYFYTNCKKIVLPEDSSYLFQNWTMLQSPIDVTRFDTRNVRDLSHIFQYAGYGVPMENDIYVDYDFSSWDTSKVTNMECMFDRYGYRYKDVKLTFGGMFTTKNVTVLQEMFSLTASFGLSKLDLCNSFEVDSCTNLHKMFFATGEGSYKFSELDLGDNFDTSKVEDFSYMFYQCGFSALVNFNLGDKFTFESGKDLSYLFFNLGNFTLTEFNHPEWHCEAAEDTSYMFSGIGAKHLKRFELNDNFNLKNAVNTSHMFASLGYEEMEYFSLGNNFNCVSSEDMSYMFAGLGKLSLKEFDLGDNFGGDSCKTMERMFRNACGRLSNFSFGGHFASDNVENFSGMFAGFASNSTFEYFSMPEGFTGAKGTNYSEMFEDFCEHGCLKVLTFGNKVNTHRSLTFFSIFDNCAPGTLETLFLGKGFDFSTAYFSRDPSALLYVFRGCGSSNTTVYGPIILTDSDYFGIDKYDLKFHFATE